MKPEFFYSIKGRFAHTVAHLGGGAPTVQPINLGKEVQQVRQQFGPTAATYRGFTAGEPLLAGASNLAQTMMGNVPSLTAPIQGALTGTINPILQSGGALTPGQRSQTLNDIRAAQAGSGMLRTNPGIFQQGMDLFNLEQNRFANAYQQAITGTQALQGIPLNAINAALATEQGGISAFTGIFDPLANVASTVAQANQQAQAANATAAANKQAGTTSGIFSSLGAVGAAAIGI